MIEDSDRTRGVRRGVRPTMACVAVILGAATAVACGDSSDDAAPAATKAADAPAQSKAAQAKTTPAAPAEGPDGKELTPEVRGWIDAGTPRLAAVRIGTPGKLVVEPKGNVNYWDHYYPSGTVVTVRAKDTKTARFAAWSGTCTGTKRVCKVKVTGYVRLIAGFDLDKAAAKGLPKNDPALKPSTGP